jgi:hypothetical protein
MAQLLSVNVDLPRDKAEAHAHTLFLVRGFAGGAWERTSVRFWATLRSSASKSSMAGR